MPPPDTEQTRWFSTEVLPHEPALRSFLQARFPTIADIDDIVQETYRRVLHEHTAGRLQHVRAFMFTAARNIALDICRRRSQRVVTTIPHPAELHVVQEEPDAGEALNRHQELELLAQAVQSLPDRCRHVIMLRYLKGYSYQQIADALRISTETVKTHMAKGVLRCTEYFEAHGVSSGRTSLRLQHD